MSLDYAKEIARLKRDVTARDEGIRHLQSELDRAKALAGNIEKDRNAARRELVLANNLKAAVLAYFTALDTLRSAAAKIGLQ